MNAYIIYDSLSGNTKRVADLIKATLEHANLADLTIVMCNLNVSDYKIPHLNEEDYVFIGDWTCDYGNATEAVLSFIDMNECMLLNNRHVFAFGTGETQWGEEHFCGAVDTIRNELGIIHEGLKIEQYPASDEQELEIKKWTLSTLKEIN